MLCTRYYNPLECEQTHKSTRMNWVLLEMARNTVRPKHKVKMHMVVANRSLQLECHICPVWFTFTYPITMGGHCGTCSGNLLTIWFHLLQSLTAMESSLIHCLICPPSSSSGCISILPLTVLWRMIFAKPVDLVTWPYHFRQEIFVSPSVLEFIINDIVCNGSISYPSIGFDAGVQNDVAVPL